MSDETRSFDLIVIGAGGAGMTSALVAAIEGLRPLVIEKSPLVGGTTALSAGSVWIPSSHHAADGQDSFEKALAYLDAVVGDRSPAALKKAFLTNGPEMVRCLEQSSEVRLRAYPHHPDYFPDAPGGTLAGRALEPLAFDGRRLGSDFALLRPPLPEFTLLRGMMVDRTDIGHLLKIGKSAASTWHGLRLLARYGRDRLRHHRGTRLVMGNALAGRLLRSLRTYGVPVWTQAVVREIIIEQKSVAGALVETAGRTEIIKSPAVIVATGGFNHHPVHRRKIIGEPVPEWSLVIAENRGDGIDLMIAAGGTLGEGHDDGAFWSPVSVRERRDGSTAVFPHFVLDRGKPGLIAVGQSGRRFVNEAAPYHVFGRTMRAAHARTPVIPCCFVCDRAFIAKYGLGMVRPGAHGLRGFLRDGYLTQADTIAQLAAKLGIDPAGLAESVAESNRFAAAGRDLAFGKGEDAYGRNLGDPANKPNPCLGPISSPPFYAIRVYPGDIGASCGIRTDEAARVLDAAGEPITGLLACGNDMHSVMGGAYPGPGITLGPGMTFAYIAAHEALKLAKKRMAKGV